MDKATCAAIARDYEVDRDDGRGESGAREGGEGRVEGGGGGGWLSGLSAAAPEVPLDVELGSADQGVPGGSKDKSAKQNTGEEKKRRRRGMRAMTRAKRRARQRAMRTGTRRRMGRAAWNRRTRRPEALVRRFRNDFRLSMLGVWCACAGPKGPVIARRMPEFAYIFKY
jgi:hypothetical protein